MSLELLFELTLAILLGGLVGLERECRGKPTGVRTTILICVGAVLFTRLSQSIALGNHSLREALCRAGASSATIVPEPLAAVAGAGLDLTAPYAQLLVDVERE